MALVVRGCAMLSAQSVVYDIMSIDTLFMKNTQSQVWKNKPNEQRRR